MRKAAEAFIPSAWNIERTLADLRELIHINNLSLNQVRACFFLPSTDVFFDKQFFIFELIPNSDLSLILISASVLDCSAITQQQCRLSLLSGSRWLGTQSYLWLCFWGWAAAAGWAQGLWLCTVCTCMEAWRAYRRCLKSRKNGCA